MSERKATAFRVGSDKLFLIGLGVLGGSYLLIILMMLVADLVFLDYGDKPILGPELVKQGNYSDEKAEGAPLTVEPGRTYQFRMGENEVGLQHGNQRITGNGLFETKNDEVVLLPRGKNKPITASLRAEARVTNISIEKNLATLETDVSHGLIWGAFIRVTGADQAGWEGFHKITDTNATHLSFVLPKNTKPVENLSLSIPNPLIQALRSEDIQFSIKLSLISCTLTTLFSLWVAVPIGYLMSRFQFRGKPFIDTLLDIPIVLPPLVIGLSLLILFRYAPDWLSEAVVYQWPAVVLAQFMVACAFAVRTMRVTFDQIPQRFEQVALTLGCNRRQAFWRVIMPQAKGGLLAAGTLAWARALGEFGPILVFAGTTRQKTEVLPTSAYLELQAGRTEGMLAVSLIMIAAAAIVFIAARTLGMKRIFA